MKRVMLTLACLLMLFTLLVPTVAFATEAKTTSAATTATAESGLIVYPEAPEDATAEEAIASTEWQKSGDVMNLVIALLSFGGIIAIVIWGVIASRKATSVA